MSGQGAREPCQLYLIADDFGRSSEANAAIAKAYCRGVLTGASLMVAGPAFHDAVKLARQLPGLRVGLHVVVAGGQACLTPAELPHLVDRAGWFPASPARAGLRYAFVPAARTELSRELRAQFARFAETGLPLAHVDGHMHMHLHPVVFRQLEPLFKEYRVPRVRVVHDDLLAALAWDHSHLARKLAWAATFGLLSLDAGRRLRALGITTTERTYGLFQSGEMAESYVAQLLGRMKARSAEIYFHPTTGPRLDPLGPNPTDLATLLSPQIRQLVHQAQIGADLAPPETILNVPPVQRVCTADDSSCVSA